MPLSQKQRKIVQEGYAHCQACGEHLAALRRIGYPNESEEERQAVRERMYQEALAIVAEFDAQKSQAKK